MEQFIKEKPLFEYLKTSDKPIYMYGMGDGGEKLKSILDSFSLNLAGIFASDEYVRGQKFLGYTVLRYSDVPDNAIILSAFGVHDDVMLKRFEEISVQKEFYAPEMPLFGDMILFDDKFLAQNIGKIKLAFSLLEDAQSKKVFLNTINNKLSGKISYLFDMQTPKDEIYDNILQLGESESYLDLGAYDGDTVEEFLKFSHNNFKKIIALEPDPKTFKKLTEKTLHLNIERHNIGVYDCNTVIKFSGEASRNSSISNAGTREITVVTIDDLIGNDPISYIKMDVEGSESCAIAGAIQTLKSQKPKLMISAYHRTGDFFELILQLHSINPTYKFYLRHQPYVPNWETNIIAV